MVGDHPWHLSPGASFEYQVKVPNSKSVVHFLLVDFGDFGGWVTILGMAGDHPGECG